MTEVETYLALMEAKSIVIECCIKAGRPELHSRIVVEWDAKLATTMGMAHTNHLAGTARLCLNPALWERATPEERRQTSIHEAAHALANIIHRKGCGHGPEWKAIMVRLGATPDRCHSVSTAGIRKRATYFVLPCPRCATPIRFSARERAGVQTGTIGRKHGACGYTFTAADVLRADGV